MNPTIAVEIFARHRWLRWLGLLALVATIWIANTILWLHVGYIAEISDARFLILAAAGHLVAGWLAGRVGLRFRWLALASVFIGPWALFSVMGLMTMVRSLIEVNLAHAAPGLVAIATTVGAAALGFVIGRKRPTPTSAPTPS